MKKLHFVVSLIIMLALLGILMILWFLPIDKKPIPLEDTSEGILEVGIEEIALLDVNEVHALMFLDPVPYALDGKIKLCLSRTGFNAKENLSFDFQNVMEDEELLESMVLKFQEAERSKNEYRNRIQVIFCIVHEGQTKACYIHIGVRDGMIYGKDFKSKELYEDFTKIMVE